MENFEETPRWELTDDRKTALLAAADDLKKLLTDRNPPPDYMEVSEAIDKINWENDRA